MHSFPLTESGMMLTTCVCGQASFYGKKEKKASTQSDVDRITVAAGTTTKKVTLKKGVTLEEATLIYFRYVMDNKDGITRVQFRYGTRGYIIIAKLKEAEIEGEI